MTEEKDDKEKKKGKVVREGDAFYIEEETETDTPPEPEQTPMADENEKIQGKSATIQYQKNFHDLFLEIHDLDKGYVLAKEGFTNALMGGGVNSNPQEVYQYIDMLTTRLEKIHIIRRLCGMLGLQGDMDKILDYELDLLYKTRSPLASRKTTNELTSPIAGEFSHEPKRRRK